MSKKKRQFLKSSRKYIPTFKYSKTKAESDIFQANITENSFYRPPRVRAYGIYFDTNPKYVWYFIWRREQFHAIYIY